jgi:hypothetical protein
MAFCNLAWFVYLDWSLGGMDIEGMNDITNALISLNEHEKWRSNMNYTTDHLILFLKNMMKICLAQANRDHPLLDGHDTEAIVYSIKQRLLAAENLVDVVKNEGSSTQDFEAALDRWDRS